MDLTISQLAQRLGAGLQGDGSGRISSVGPVESAESCQVTFVSDDKLISKLGGSKAGAVIVKEPIKNLNIPQIIVKNVNAALIEALKIFAPVLKPAPVGIDPSATVAKDAKIEDGVSIGPYVVIESAVTIGAKTIIGSGCKIGQNSKIGKNSRLDSNVVVYHNCSIGNNVIIQANTTIGSTGFGYYFIDGAHRLIPHNGGVIIEDYVEIGANCSIDRAKFGNTVIGAGTKIDNLVQIAHNVTIGRCCLIIAQVGIAGNCKVGEGVVIAGQAGMADNIKIGDGVMIGAQAGVMQSVEAGRKLLGSPAIEPREYLKLPGFLKRMPKLIEQLQKLNARVEKLEAAKDIKS
jgi:UDP-3-O-[3-hydroxymyristoyl] glucosamine N-acyltransferase